MSRKGSAHTQGTASRHAIAILLIAVATASFWIAGAAKPAAAYPPQNRPNMITWNMCGGVCNHGLITPAQDIANLVAFDSPLPISVALQETCSNQYSWLLTKLPQYSLNNGWAYWSNAGVCDSGQYHGNSVFWAGGCYGGGFNCVYTKKFSQQHPNDPETAYGRGFVCGKQAFIVSAACSAHVTNKKPGDNNVWYDYRVDQINEYRSTLDLFNYISAPTWGSGDLNFTCCGSPAWPGYWELDMFYLQATRPGSGKIDYQYVPDSSMCGYPPAFIFDAPNSDHHYYVGYFGFNC